MLEFFGDCLDLGQVQPGDARRLARLVIAEEVDEPGGSTNADRAKLGGPSELLAFRGRKKAFFCHYGNCFQYHRLRFLVVGCLAGGSVHWP